MHVIWNAQSVATISGHVIFSQNLRAGSGLLWYHTKSYSTYHMHMNTYKSWQWPWALGLHRPGLSCFVLSQLPTRSSSYFPVCICSWNTNREYDMRYISCIHGQHLGVVPASHQSRSVSDDDNLHKLASMLSSFLTSGRKPWIHEIFFFFFFVSLISSRQPIHGWMDHGLVGLYETGSGWLWMVYMWTWIYHTVLN